MYKNLNEKVLLLNSLLVLVLLLEGFGKQYQQDILIYLSLLAIVAFALYFIYVSYLIFSKKGDKLTKFSKFSYAVEILAFFFFLTKIYGFLAR